MSVGIDYSMGCPAACVYTAAGAPRFWFASARKYSALPNITFHHVSTSDMIPRAEHTAAALVAWITPFVSSGESLAIEDYAFSATGRQFHIGEHAGILKLHLYRAEIPYTCVPPTVIKKHATGKGNADKRKMTAQFLAQYPQAHTWIPTFFPRTKPDADIAKSPLADLADAYWIAAYAFHTLS